MASRKKLETLAETITDGDVAKAEDVRTFVPGHPWRNFMDQFSFERAAAERPGLTVAEFYEERDRSSAALVARLEANENDPVLKGIWRLEAAVDDLKVAQEDLREWLHEQVDELKGELKEVREMIEQATGQE